VTVLTYRGYQGSVEYEDGELVIEVLHVRDLLLTVVDSAADAESAFRSLVDEYLAACEEEGVDPDRPFKGSFNVRVGPELHRAAALAAVQSDETLNSWVASAIREKIAAKATMSTDEILRLSQMVRSGAQTTYQIYSSVSELDDDQVKVLTETIAALGMRDIGHQGWVEDADLVARWGSTQAATKKRMVN